VTVIDRNDKNAFVLPTGNIFVFAGMLDMCHNDDQVGLVNLSKNHVSVV
jgi:predicted Zn-dependent protease